MKTENEIEREINRLGVLLSRGVVYVQKARETNKVNGETFYIEKRIEILQAEIDMLNWVLGEGE